MEKVLNNEKVNFGSTNMKKKKTAYILFRPWPKTCKQMLLLYVVSHCYGPNIYWFEANSKHSFKGKEIFA